MLQDLAIYHFACFVNLIFALLEGDIRFGILLFFCNLANKIQGLAFDPIFII